MIREIMMPLAVGLALFLFGMQIMRIGLTNLAGDRIKDAVIKFTKTPVHGMLIGTIATALVQSSSAITVLTIGLVNARLITFPQTIGIILGANIGTSFTTELIALKISDYAVPMLVLGTIGFLTRHHLSRCIGLFFCWFRMYFYGDGDHAGDRFSVKKCGLFRPVVALYLRSSDGHRCRYGDHGDHSKQQRNHRDGHELDGWRNDAPACWNRHCTRCQYRNVHNRIYREHWRNPGGQTGSLGTYSAECPWRTSFHTRHPLVGPSLRLPDANTGNPNRSCTDHI